MLQRTNTAVDTYTKILYICEYQNVTGVSCSVYHSEKIFSAWNENRAIFQYGYVLCYLWHLNSNMLWLVKTLVAVISGKGGVEEINLRQGNNNGLKHGFSFLFRQ